VVGVAAYALRDLLCWRGWNDSPRAERSIGASRAAGVRRAARNLRRSLHAVRGLADYRLVAVAVLAVGIGSNVSLFTLARGALPRPMVGVLAGIGLVLLIACAHLASVTLCAGLRRRRDRPRA
jgi:predicted acyltransferase